MQASPLDNRNRKLTGDERRKLNVLVLIVVSLLVTRLLAYWIMHPLLIGHDNALHLQIAQMMLEGKMLYVDIIDVNLPMIYYLNLLPAFVSKLLNVPLPLCYNLFVGSLAAYCVLGSAFVLLRRASHPDYKLFPFVLFGLCSFNLLLQMDYGQREHLFLIMFMPYFFLRWLRWNNFEIGRAEGLIIGVIAALGVCLKHYFIVPIAACELFWCLEKGKIKPLFAHESLAFTICGSIYLLHFAFFPEPMKQSYFGFILPAFQLGYQFWDTSFAKNLMSNWTKGLCCLLLLSGTAAVILQRRTRLLLPILVFGLFGLVIYLMQFKGWLYQRMPSVLSTYLLIYIEAGIVFYAIWNRFKPSSVAATLKLASAATVICFIAITVSFGRGLMDVFMGPPFQMSRVGYNGVCSRDDLSMMFQDLMSDNVKLGETVVVLANGVAPAYPTMTQLRIQPGSRYPHVCILSVLEYIKSRWKTTESKRLVDFEGKIIAAIGSDILRNRPELVVIQSMPVAGYIEPFNFMELYMKDYIKVGRIEGYDVYRRAPEAPRGPVSTQVPSEPVSTQAPSEVSR